MIEPSTSTVSRSSTTIGGRFCRVGSTTLTMIEAVARRLRWLVTSYVQRNTPDAPSGGVNVTR